MTKTAHTPARTTSTKRRPVAVRTASLVGTSLAAALLFVGCGSADSESDTATSDSAASAETSDAGESVETPATPDSADEATDVNEEDAIPAPTEPVEIPEEAEEFLEDMGVETDLPDEWPAELPTPEGFTLLSAADVGAPDVVSYSVIFQAAGDVDTMPYFDSLIAAGFEPQTEVTPELTPFVSQDWDLVVGSASDGNLTTITVTLLGR